MNVFISYAREDRDHADKLSGALEARGWSVWWDPRIPAGQSFDETIERELETADCVVVLWSKHSILSEWVKNEAAAALDRGVLIPALIDDVKLPLAFRRRQAAELVGWNGDPSHAGFRALCSAIAGTVPISAVPSSTGRIAPRATRFSWRHPPLFSGIAATAVLLALGYGLWGVAPADESTGEQKGTVLPAATMSGTAEASGSQSSLSGSAATAAAGVFDFKWPGGDCWAVYRGEAEAKRSCGAGKHALQAGTYLVKPLTSSVFEPFSITVKPEATTIADANAGIFEFKWPGGDCWAVYRGEVEAKRSCGADKHALQAGTYLVKPLTSGVFEPFSVRVQRSQAASVPTK